MDYLFEKVAYLKGLADGLELTEDTKEGKLYKAMIDVIEEIANGMEEIVEEQDDVNEYLDLLDEDLSNVEKEIFGDDYEFDDYDDFEFDEDDDLEDCNCGCGCGCDEE